MVLNSEHTKAINELEVAMQYFNYATEIEHIDKAIDMINTAEAKIKTEKTN